jgi:hypothetical protein
MSQENVDTIARLYDEFLARPERLSDPEVLPEVLWLRKKRS